MNFQLKNEIKCFILVQNLTITNVMMWVENWKVNQKDLEKFTTLSKHIRLEDNGIIVKDTDGSEILFWDKWFTKFWLMR